MNTISVLDETGEEQHLPLTELTSLLYVVPPHPIPKCARKMFLSGFLERKEEKKTSVFLPRSSNYGQVISKILTYLKEAGPSSPFQISNALSIHEDSVRRAIRSMSKSSKIICAQRERRGRNRAPSIWKINE